MVFITKVSSYLLLQVLTSTSCSEEGLEDATNVLLQLSRANNATREMVLSLLLDGAQQLGLVVCQHIRCVMEFYKPQFEIKHHLLSNQLIK